MTSLLDLLGADWPGDRHPHLVCDDGVLRPEASFRELAHEDYDWLMENRAVRGVNCQSFHDPFEALAFALPFGLPIRMDAPWAT